MRKIRVPDLIRKRQNEEKIVAITAYDATFSSIVDAAGVDLILVGDSLGTVIQGQETTLPVTLDEIIYHTKAVRRGCKNALLVADMPFLSYQVSVAEAIAAAGRVLKESGAEAVKLEGGSEMCATVTALVQRGIPVMGHLGLTPQSVHTMGGYRVQGKSQADAERLLSDAKELEEAGVFSLVLEGIPSELSDAVTNSLEIPTIGIGAGPNCSGQILVLYDLLGLSNFGDSAPPKFVKEYQDFRQLTKEAIESYGRDVQTGVFPAKENSYGTGVVIKGENS